MASSLKLQEWDPQKSFPTQGCWSAGLEVGRKHYLAEEKVVEE